MTVYTKQPSPADEEKKPEAEVEYAVQVAEVPAKKGAEEPNDEATIAVNEIAQRRRIRQRRLCLQFVLLLTLVIGISICLLGALYIHRRNSAKSYKGRCGVRYSPKHQQSQELTTAAADDYIYVDEEIVIEEDVETLDVPKFDDNDEARFINDFMRNFTTIKDWTNGVCYVLPLNRERLPNPDVFIFKLYTGQKVFPTAREISDNFKLQMPAMEPDAIRTLLGDYVADQCMDFTTYRLVSASAEDVTTTTTAAPVVRRFAMYAGGDFLIQFVITF